MSDPDLYSLLDQTASELDTREEIALHLLDNLKANSYFLLAKDIRRIRAEIEREEQSDA